MTIAQGAGAVMWDWMALGLSILTALCVWYFTIIGRDRNPKTQKRGEEHVENYGDLQQNHAPVPKFLIWTYIGVAVWALGYAILTGLYGYY